MKVSLKVGFGGNCILRQEVANFVWRIRIEFLFFPLFPPVAKFRMQKRLFYGSKMANFNMHWPSLLLFL